MADFTKRQSEIIEKSLEIITEKGIQGLTIKNLSKSIGISEPAIYRHFESKIDILLAILKNFRANAGKMHVNNSTIEISTIKRIEAFYSMAFQNFSKNPSYVSVIFSEAIFQFDKRLSTEVYSIMNLNLEKMENIIKQGQQKGEISKEVNSKQLALILLGSQRLMVTRWRLSDYSFDLIDEGKKLFKTMQKLISCP